MNEPFTCPTCGAHSHGKYCPSCGEKRVEERDRYLWHYLKVVFTLAVQLDTKVLRSVLLLVGRPGFMSTEFLEGRRVRYLSPLRLFVLVSVVYYVSLTFMNAHVVARPAGLDFNTFTTPLQTQLHGNDFYPAYAARRVARKMRLDNISLQALEQKYDKSTAELSKTLLFVLIPVIAMLFAVLFWRRKYISEHLAIATHFWSFVLVLLGVLLPVTVTLLVGLDRLFGLSLDQMLTDVVVSYVLQAVLAVYLFRMLRRVYRASLWYSGLLSLVLAWSFFFIVWLFRYFLFEVTLQTI
jgi:Protein of unknown function (DUF3667)